MNRADKEVLIDQFRTYLEQWESPDPAGELPPGDERTDLYTFYIELAALKNEVRIESRQLKTALDQFREVFETLNASHDQLQESLTREKTARMEAGRQAIRPLLLELLELRDRMEAALTPPPVVIKTNFFNFNWLCPPHPDSGQAIREGIRMNLRRLDQILSGQGVQPIVTVGQPLDPHHMRATNVVNRSDVASGIVVEEIRKGFTWDGILVRPAEVIVNQ
ncbi:MAG: nucleotide exchange factor GrpE [Magnetococcus sp. DMHC-6]